MNENFIVAISHAETITTNASYTYIAFVIVLYAQIEHYTIGLL